MHELICSWLGLSGGCWPPDHYRLLGLDPGEADLCLIEQRVHQKLDSIRCYQMMHPEQATEAMNRLAQAFVCLTCVSTKKAYDEELLGPPSRSKLAPPPLPVPPRPTTPPPPTKAIPPVPQEKPFEWLGTPNVNGPSSGSPPPLPMPPPPPLPAVIVEQEPDPAPPVPAQPPPPAAPQIDPIVEAARFSPQARRGLATRRQLHRRVAQTRQLQRLWHKMRKYLEDHNRPLSSADAKELYRTVQQVEEELDEGFPLLGVAGQPGYLIVSLTQLEKAKELLTLTISQRESLERDWKAGLRFLEAHRDFLRDELVAFRKIGRVQKLFMALRSMLHDQPLVTILIALGILALGVALIRTYL